jgi:hypothetical protein
VKGIGVWLLRGFFLLPFFPLAWSGFVHLRDGQALDSSFPVPLYMSLNQEMPKVAYLDAASALNNANRDDGSARLSLAEAEYHAGAAHVAVENDLIQSLSHLPGSAPAWLLYAQIQPAGARPLAAKAFDMSLSLGPHDYFLLGPQVLTGASLWRDLSAQSQAQIEERTRLLWQTPALRTYVVDLLRDEDGRLLIMNSEGPEQIRVINRWISAMRRNAEPVSR